MKRTESSPQSASPVEDLLASYGPHPSIGCLDKLNAGASSQMICGAVAQRRRFLMGPVAT